MKTYTREELSEVLRQHRVWLNGHGGSRADLHAANLFEENLSEEDLRSAYLRYADLRGANLRKANLSGANLSGADLRGAYLSDANLHAANLSGADLRGAYLGNADLSGTTLPNFQIVPEEGDFIAYKRVVGAALKLKIPGRAKRTSSLVGRKCRASAAYVISATRDDGEKSGRGDRFFSTHTPAFMYTVGHMAEELAYDGDIRLECAAGIHFFVTRKEAEEYR